MSASQQFSANTYEEQHSEPRLQHAKKDFVRSGPCPSLQLLSESAAKLLMATQSNDELGTLTSARLRTYVRRPDSEMELETFRTIRPSARPTSSASLTLNDYVLPSSGDSTPTSSGSSSCSVTGYSTAAAASSGDDSIGSSVFRAAPASTPAPDDDDTDPEDPHPMPSDPPTSGEAASGEAVAPPVRGDEDGPFVPREIHAVDVQLARMLAAVSQATNASPAQLLQVLLNFAPEDCQDLVNALAESGCSSVYLLACHLHNLRTMAEEAIDDTSGGDGEDAPAGEDAGATAGGGPLAAARSGKAAADGHAGRKGRAAGAAASPPQDKAAQEALRASILDQYRRVVCRLMDTALSFMQQDSPRSQGAAPPPPPPPPPPSGRSVGGGGGRGRAEQLSRSRSTPIPSSFIPVIPPPPPPPGTASASLRGGPGSKALSAGAATPRTAATPRVASAGAAASGGGATAFNDPAASAAGVLVGGVLQAVMQQLGPGTAADAVEAWTGHDLGAAAAKGRSTAGAEQLLASHSALAARGRSMSQSLTATPVGNPAAARNRSVTVGSYMGVGAGAGTPAVHPAVAGRHAGAGPAAPPTLRTVAVGAQSRAVANPPQRLYQAEVRLDQRHAAALLLQQERQLQQQQLLQQRLQLQRLQQQQLQHRRLQQQLQQQQQLQLQQHLHQQLQQQQHLQQQQQQQQQLQELQLLELLAAANADAGAAFGASLQVMPPPDLAPQADALSVAAAAHLMQTYDGAAAAAFAEPLSVWRPTEDPVAALHQLHQRQVVPPAMPFTANPVGHAAPLHHTALSQHQQLMMAMQGGLLPAVGAGAVGGHAGAGAAMPYSATTAFGAQLLTSGWMI